MLRTFSEKETFSKMANATPFLQSMGSSKQISPGFLKLVFTIHCKQRLTVVGQMPNHTLLPISNIPE